MITLPPEFQALVIRFFTVLLTVCCDALHLAIIAISKTKSNISGAPNEPTTSNLGRQDNSPMEPPIVGSSEPSGPVFESIGATASQPIPVNAPGDASTIEPPPRWYVVFVGIQPGVYESW
jgi:hypothetical protein